MLSLTFHELLYTESIGIFILMLLGTGKGDTDGYICVGFKGTVTTISSLTDIIQWFSANQ